MKTKLLLTAILFMLAVNAVFAASPAIISFSPVAGPVGTLVTITGTNLGGPTTFTIGGRAAIVVSNNGSQLVGYVMPNAATGPIAITTAGGSVSSNTNFTVTATSYPSQQKGNPMIAATDYRQAEIGSSVAISADGTTAIVGGPDYYTGPGINPGVALVFVYSGGIWTQQAEFSASNFSPAQGRSVALSADGNTAMVGGSQDDSTSVNSTSIGAVWFYTRVGAVWSEEGRPVMGTGYTLYPSQGYSCALSADGNTAIEGGLNDNGGIGAAWIFTRSNGTWTQQGPKLVPSDNTGNANFGNSVAISADGNTAVVGGYIDNTGINAHNEQTVAGATWIFTRAGSTWSQQGGKLVATGGSSYNQQGTAVAVSADGNTMVTSGPGSNSVWIFTRNGATWSQLGSALPETAVTGNPGNGIQAGFGSGVAMSADGNTVVVGDSRNGSFDGPGPGGTWVFARSGNTYVQQEGALLGTGTGTTTYPGQGAAVALSANGTAFITGGPPNGTNNQGAAWAFMGNANASLANLKISKGTLSPAFVTGTTTYTASVVSSVTSIDVTPTTSDPNATVLVNNTVVKSGTASGAIPLNTGANTITITGVAPDGAPTQTYTLTITRPPSTNANLAGIGSSITPLTPIFTSATTSYTLNVSNATKTMTVKPVSADADATLTVNGTALTSGTMSAPIALTEGANTAINVKVTAQDGTTVKTYTITVSRAPSADATLAVINSSVTPLTPVFSPGTATYTLHVNYPVATMTVSPVTTDANATMTVNGTAATSGATFGPVALTSGAATTITVMVTAQNGAIKTYTLTVTRAVSNDASLASINSSIVPLTPAFVPANTGYTLNVSNATKTMTIAPVTNNVNATMTINGTAITSGTLFGPVLLSEGHLTVITTVVKAQDGNTTKTYTITVNRAASGNADLTSMNASVPPLTPAFAAGTTGYTLNVSNATKTITVRPVASDANATITVNGANVASGSTSNPVTLAEGVATTVTVHVTAQNGATKTYTVAVTRAASGNANLASMGPSISPLTPFFGPSKTSYTLSVSNATTTMTVTPVTADPNATITVNTASLPSGSTSNPVALTPGATTTITVVVTAQDGSTKTYTIAVTRAPGGADSYDPGISVTKPIENVSTADDGIVVHEGVSPNGDGVNDFLQIDNISRYPDNKLSVMSRNGQLVYEVNGYDNSSKIFNGHSNKNGQMQLPGTYFYQLDYTVNGVTKHKTGFIVLKY